MRIADLNLNSLNDIAEKMAEALGGKRDSWKNRLRAAVKAGDLECVRFDTSCNAKIFLQEDTVAKWIATTCNCDSRQIVQSPSQIAKINNHSKLESN